MAKRTYTPEQKEQKRLYNKERYVTHKDQIAKYHKEWAAAHKDWLTKYKKEYRVANKDKIDLHNKEYCLANKDKKAAYDKDYRSRNRVRLCEYQKEYRAANKDKLARQHREYEANRKKTDHRYKLVVLLRSRLYDAVKRNQKAGSAVRDLGCSIEEFKTYIEDQFQEGMSWENHGEWHLDHIIPLSAFDLTNRDEFLIACHFTNYQPLWATDNIRKGSKICNIT